MARHIPLNPPMRFLGCLLVAFAFWLGEFSGRGCELCAIYNAVGAQGNIDRGFAFNVSEQFTSLHTVQFQGHEVSFPNHDQWDDSVTHVVPTWNFSDRLGVAANIPFVYRTFRRTELRYTQVGAGVQTTFHTVTGTESGLGDAALVGRWTIWKKNTMKAGIFFNLLAGVKFPTGETDRIRDEVDQAKLYNRLVGPGHPHDVLGVPVSSLHQHELSAGTGSWDGVFGLTMNSRWRDWFFNDQFQYYLRTDGESSYRFGDMLIVSGGPGKYFSFGKTATLSVQANATYETQARDRLFDVKSNHTGTTLWYFGPQILFTWGLHFSAQAAVDVPLRAANNGFQNVPDLRLRGGMSWRF